MGCAAFDERGNTGVAQAHLVIAEAGLHLVIEKSPVSLGGNLLDERADLGSRQISTRKIGGWPGDR